MNGELLISYTPHSHQAYELNMLVVKGLLLGLDLHRLLVDLLFRLNDFNQVISSIWLNF